MGVLDIIWITLVTVFCIAGLLNLLYLAHKKYSVAGKIIEEIKQHPRIVPINYNDSDIVTVTTEETVQEEPVAVEEHKLDDPKLDMYEDPVVWSGPELAIEMKCSKAPVSPKDFDDRRVYCYYQQDASGVWHKGLVFTNKQTQDDLNNNILRFCYVKSAVTGHFSGPVIFEKRNIKYYDVTDKELDDFIDSLPLEDIKALINFKVS